jgi:hypothetical protein
MKNNGSPQQSPQTDNPVFSTFGYSKTNSHEQNNIERTHQMEAENKR